MPSSSPRSRPAPQPTGDAGWRARPSARWIALVAIAATAAVSIAEPPPLAGSANRPIAVEAFPLTREDLASRAEVIVHGTVESIAVERDLNNLFDERSFTAILLVDRVERGEGIAPGDRLSVEYWRRQPLAEGASDSVGGYWPLPWKGDETWVFARRDVENPSRLTPLLPNGWEPDETRASDPDGLYGGTLGMVRDDRTASLLPWAIAAFAGAGLVAIVSLKAGPQSRGAMLLLAAGLAAAGAALAMW